ncbi:hypothetical protein HFE01_06695 [Paenibacillus sp. EKM10P]|nr:hypothetical protein HFE01_06695 [Paenibacillus sp. EKM10P]
MKLERLRMKIINNGWQDESPTDFNLIKTLDGNYVVDGGGNHRAYLSNELEIKEVKARVWSHVELNKLSKEEFDQYKIYKDEISGFYKQFKIYKIRGDEEKQFEFLHKAGKLEEKLKAFLLKIYNGSL